MIGYVTPSELQEILEPRFEIKYSRWDWRSFVPPGMQSIWDIMPEDAKIATYLCARYSVEKAGIILAEGDFE